MKKLVVVTILFWCFHLNDGFAQCWDESFIELADPQNVDIPNISAFPDGQSYYMDNTNSWVYYSNDFGSTWNKIKRISTKYSYDFNKLFFITPKKGWALFSDSIYRTNDGGKTWIGTFYELYNGGGTTGIIHFYNEFVGWIDDDDNFCITTNGGITWNCKSKVPILTLSTNYSPDTVFSNRSRGGGYSISYDTGYTWKKVIWPTKSELNCFQFIDKDNGFVLLMDTVYNKGFSSKGGSIGRTRDGGKTWTFINSLPRNIVSGIGDYISYGDYLIFSDTLNGLFYSQDEDGYTTLHRTKDGGNTWKKQKISPQKWVTDFIQNKISFPSKDFALIATEQQYFLRYLTPLPPDCNLVVVVDSLQKDKPISWYPPAGCVGGYVLKIGTTNNGGEIVDSLDVGDTLQWLPNKALPYGKDIYVSIRPYNDGGFAPKCNAVIVPTKSCTLTTRIDTIIKIGTPIYNKIYTNDTLITKAYKSQQGCDSIVNIYVDVLTSNQDLPVEFIQSLTVAPNPTAGNLQVTFQLKSATSGKLYITDRQGRTLWQSENKDWSTGQQTLDLEVSQYPSGVYQLHWQSNRGRIVVSWMKGG